MRTTSIVAKVAFLLFVLVAGAAWIAGGGLDSGRRGDLPVEEGSAFADSSRESSPPPVPTNRDLKPRPAPQPPPSASSTLFERVGGTYPIAALVDEYLNRLAVDPVITANPQVKAALEPRKVPGLKFQITAFVIEAMDGPYSYHGKTMVEVHRGLGITAAEWQASGRVLQATLDHFRVPQREQDDVIALIESTRGDIVTGGGARPPSTPQPSGARP